MANFGAQLFCGGNIAQMAPKIGVNSPVTTHLLAQSPLVCVAFDKKIFDQPYYLIGGV